MSFNTSYQTYPLAPGSNEQHNGCENPGAHVQHIAPDSNFLSEQQSQMSLERVNRVVTDYSVALRSLFGLTYYWKEKHDHVYDNFKTEIAKKNAVIKNQQEMMMVLEKRLCELKMEMMCQGLSMFAQQENTELVNNSADFFWVESRNGSEEEELDVSSLHAV